MSRDRTSKRNKSDCERDDESINCCQLNVHKKLIRERKADRSECPEIDINAKRACTDILCLFVFLAALIGWIIVSVIVYKNGDPRKIMAPLDSSNRRCGYDKGVEDRPNLFFFDITKCLPPRKNVFHCDTRQVCVEKCPETNFSSSYYLQRNVPLGTIKRKLICIDEFNKDRQINNYLDVENAVRGGYCADWYMESEPTVRLCLPRYLLNAFSSDSLATVQLPEGGNSEIKGVTTGLIRLGMNEVKKGKDIIRKIGEDLLETWPFIVGFMFFAMFVSFVFIVLMKWISGVMVWSSIVSLLCLLSFSSFYTWKKYAEVKNQKNSLQSSGIIQLPNVSYNVRFLESDLLKNEYTWLALFVLSISSLAIITVILIFLRRRLLLAIQLIKEGSKAVSYAWTSLLLPLFQWAFQLLLFVQAAVIFCLLVGERIPTYRVTGMKGSDCTCSNGYKDGDICDVDGFKNNCRGPLGGACLTADCSFSGNDAESFVIYLHLFNLLMVLWCEFFIYGFGQISLAMTFSTYYWTRTRKELPLCIVGSSVMKVFEYHLGTVAFGSLLLALLSWVRILIELFHRYINKNDNAIVKCLRCCCGFFLACLHKLLRILTKNAYIMCAMKGSNYCSSARAAFDLIIRNVIRASVLDGVTTFLFFLMKLLITVTAGVIAYFFFNAAPNIGNVRDNDYGFIHYFAPVFVICLGTFLISSLFFGVYSIAVDTVFLCALVDMERNDGSQQRPYVMSKRLMKIFKVRNRITS